MTTAAEADVPGRIVVDSLTKDFGRIRAVDDLSFTVEPGSVTGFLGPNGAGKTTTLRMLLGLETPTRGRATIGGTPYIRLRRPTDLVGAVLDTSFHPGRSGRNHLAVYATAAGLPKNRVDEVLDIVGLTGAATRKAGGYSLGMRQRLALATALLGDPRVLVLDEPANGLDPEGIQWLRRFLRQLAEDGRTILVSSHLLAEVQQTVDRIVIIARGRLVKQGSVEELSDGAGETVVVRGPALDALVAAATEAGATAEPGADGIIRVRGLDAPAVGHLAFGHRVELHELRTERSDLEDIYFQLTRGQEEFASHGQEPGGPGEEAKA